MSDAQLTCAANTLATLVNAWNNRTSSSPPSSPMPDTGLRFFWMWAALLPVILVMAAFRIHDAYWRATMRARVRKLEDDQEVDELASTLVKRLAPSLAVEDYRFTGMRRKNATVSLGFKDLGLKLKNGHTVLDGVTGKFGAGQLVAIMGPSGAGKTTFMNVLCGKATYGNMTGHVYINGEERNIRDLRPVTGFVPQDDVVHEHLTVREQLRFSAELRGEAGTPGRVHQAVVDDVVSVMQISQIQESIVGGVEERGISGGQRKRVNIGLELAACPSLLFLDEPTSGLDATSSLMIINSLKKMTQLGMTIVMSIHQPRYSLFTLFDEVLLLGRGGRTVYLDSATGAVQYFQDLGFACPPADNPADWLMDVISGTVSSDAQPPGRLQSQFFAAKWVEHQEQVESGGQAGLRRRSSMARGWTIQDDREVIRELLEDEWDKVGVNEDADLGPQELQLVLANLLGTDPGRTLVDKLVRRLGELRTGLVRKFDFIEFLAGACTLAQCGSDPEQGRSGTYAQTASSSQDRSDLDRRVPGCFAQYRAIFYRSLVQFWRHTARRLIDNFLIVGCAVVAAIMHMGATENPGNVVIFHLGLALLTTVSCLKTFSDRPLFWRESASGINVFSFYAARVTLDTFDVALQTILYTAVYYLITEPRLTFGDFLMPCLMIAVATSGWGYLLSTLMPPCSAVTAGVVLMLVLGGVLGNPSFLRTAIGGGIFSELVSSLSMVRWSMQMFLMRSWEETGGLRYPAVPTECTALSMEQRLAVAERKMQELGVVRFNKGLRDAFLSGVFIPWFGYWGSGIFVMAMEGLVLRILGYLALKFTNRSKQV